MSYTPPAGSSARRVVQIPFSATIQQNLATTDHMIVVLTGATTVNIPTGNPTDDQVIEFDLIQDSTGGRIPTFATGWNLGNYTATTIQGTTTANQVNRYVAQFSARRNKYEILSVTPLGTGN